MTTERTTQAPQAQPLTRKEAQLIADVYKLLPTELPGFVGRQQQKDLIQFAARSLAMGMTSIAEAPTGTGKSFGYQIPGIVLAIARDKRLVISTETASLQDQIAGRDLQVLKRILEKLGMEAPSVVVKGRERYVCPLRLREKATQASLIDEDGSNRTLAAIAEAWDGKWDGVRDSLPMRVPNTIWMKVNNNRHACANDRCPMARECPHMEVKAQLKQARIIVTNHSYLLSTIAATAGSDGSKNPVTDFEKNYVVFDEAHHLHDRCIEAFASKAVINEDVMYDASGVLGAMGSVKSGLIRLRAEAMRGIGSALRANLRTIAGPEGGMHRFTLGAVPPVLADLVEEYGSALKDIIDLMEESIKAAKDKESSRASEMVLIGNANAVLGQLEEMHDSLTEFVRPADKPRAKWIDVSKEVHTVYAAPFEAASLASQMLWSQLRGTVLTSATIATLGEFGPTLASLGLPAETMTVRLSSPLDYSRARLIVPKLIVEANSKGHASMVTAMLRTHLFAGDHAGGLVYFTSRKKMEAVYASLTPEEKTTVILQGALAPTAMIAEHKRRIDAGGRSILFGLDSIAEGVDLPREYCTMVVIDKLPFPSPEDPILATHSEHLESKGLHPFPLLMLPKAGLKLAQVVGRLIRTEADWGDVWVLDRRLVEKQYGQRLVRSTPFASVLQV